MKKVVLNIRIFLILSALIFLFTVIITQGECQEIFVKIRQVRTAKQVSEHEVETVLESRSEQKSQTESRQVRILIKNSDYSSIYHREIYFQNSDLTIYYGKKIRNKMNTKKIKLSSESKLFRDSNVIKVEAGKPICWKNHSVNGNYASYKGMFYIYKTSSGLVAVNQLDMEDYVAGVISSEMGENCPLEALKAQAVSARTYILKSKKEKYKKYDAVADDSTDFQVYNRIAAGKNCIRAAKETKNIVMTYQGELIRAYYFSTSCGFTTDYRIWGKKEKKGYLQGQKLVDTDLNVRNNKDFKQFIMSCPKGNESDFPYYRWNIYLSEEQIENGIYKNMGISTGKIKKIEIHSRGSGGIVSSLTVYGTKRQISIRNQNEIRKAICSPYAKLKLNHGETVTGCSMLPSAFFYIENLKENGAMTGVRIYGGGFGHGSGMSQNGAEKMAEQGKDYKEILNTYYSGIEIREN